MANQKEKTTGLVKHTPHEQIFLKIQEKKEKRDRAWMEERVARQIARAVEEKELKKLEGEYPEEFYKMVFLREFEHRRRCDDMCFSLEELSQCSNAEIEAFEEVVFLNVRKIWKEDLSAAIFVPIFGWAFGIGFFIAYFLGCKNNTMFDRFHYLKYRKIAQKRGVSLASVIREYAGEKLKKEAYDFLDECTL